MSDLGRVELRSLQGLRHSICNRIDRVEIIPAAGASRGGCDTGALAGGVIYGRVNIVSTAEPEDAEHDHEEATRQQLQRFRRRWYQIRFFSFGRFSSLISAASLSTL